MILPAQAPVPDIDPLAPNPPGRYTDRLVSVTRLDAAEPAGPGAEIVSTPHFSLRRKGHRVEVVHRLQPEQVDDDLAGLLAEELFRPGWLSGPDVFERVFTGVVRSTVDGPLEAWARFYDNTLARMRPHPAGVGSVGGLTPVYERAMRLVPPGRVLDLGSCFGFLPLLLAERARGTVVASDIAAGTMRLLTAIAARRGAKLRTLVCDAARVPMPDKAFDTVTVIHLLEHLDPSAGRAVLREATRLAACRVVVAVPFEDEATAAYGHVRTFTRDDLVDLGLRIRRRFAVDEHHGGWLVVHL